MLIWLLVGTLAAAVAGDEQDATPDLKEVDLHRAWAAFQASLAGVEVPAEARVLFDAMAERGELPPGWILHPTLGLFHLFDAIVVVVDDDSPPNIMNLTQGGRDLNALEGGAIPLRAREPMSLFPIKLYVHANPNTTLQDQDFVYFYAVSHLIEVARRDHTPGLPTIPGVDHIFEVLEPERVEQILRRVSAELRAGREPDVHQILRAFDMHVEHPDDFEEMRVWDAFMTNPSYSEELDVLLRAHGLEIAEDGTVSIQAINDFEAFHEIDDDLAARLALKSGVMLARIPDTIGSRYHRMYVVEPHNVRQFLRRFPSR